MSEAGLASCANARSLPVSAVPRLPLAAFRRAVIEAPGRGRRVSALFGAPGAGGTVDLWLVLAADGEGLLELASCPGVGGEFESAFESMTSACPQVHLFERELAEEWGLVPVGHPWLKPVRFRRDPLPGVADFYRVAGEEVHEVAVGPVHAGVIEPGHFRFQCHGERVFHLEIALGYQHRGVERALAAGPDRRSIHYAETLAGDTTVAHATAYAQVLEGLAGARPPARGAALRGLALELERLANHTGDLGALANDVGYLPTASFCGRLRGDFLNLTAQLCGSRFGRGLVRAGGAGFDAEPARAESMARRLAAAGRDVAEAAALLWDTPSVMARLEDTGRVDPVAARDLGLVGPAARACGFGRDVRTSHPEGIYRYTHVPVATWHTGDVFARALVRWMEIERSLAFAGRLLGELPAGPVRAPCGAPRPDRVCASLVEGWRGEVCHVALTGPEGRFAAYKVVDPSFHNWAGLAMALRDGAISDFPLCNKSFNLSYCGHDL